MTEAYNLLNENISEKRKRRNYTHKAEVSLMSKILTSLFLIGNLRYKDFITRKTL